MIHFVSLGPGDPELITLKALRTLREADYIYTPVPVSRKGRHASKAAEMMLSLGIREEQIQLYDLPMSKDRDGALEAYEIVAREACEKQRSSPVPVSPSSLRVTVASTPPPPISESISSKRASPQSRSAEYQPSSPAMAVLVVSSCSSKSSVLSSQAKLLVRSGIVLGRAVIPSS